ncbi:MAG: hypothetical protein OXH32_03490 [Acidobacteria bacterium]|nr:hypothetical protein [Acidobacteriota bacterium]
MLIAFFGSLGLCSPTLHGDGVFVIWDHEDESFMVALDKNSGKEIWRRDRRDVLP